MQGLLLVLERLKLRSRTKANRPKSVENILNMHDQPATLSHVIFGWNPLWVATTLFIITYVVIVSEKVNRAIIAGLGAGLMLTLGVLTQEQAIAGVDFNTLGLLTGMMVIVAITRRCGVFQYLAIWSA